MLRLVINTEIYCVYVAVIIPCMTIDEFHFPSTRSNTLDAANQRPMPMPDKSPFRTFL